MQIMRSLLITLSWAICGLYLVTSCTKDSLEPAGEDPYKDNILPPITLLSKGAYPDRGMVGDEVLILGTGFNESIEQMEVLFNDAPAEILESTDTTLVVEVPEGASTGNIGVRVGQQYFYGPLFRMFGAMQIDTVYPGFRGANGTIHDILPLQDGKYLIGGEFTDYDNAAIGGGINRLARINADGTLDRAFTYGEGTGTLGGGVTSLHEREDGKYLIAGNFSAYANTPYVQGVALLNNEGNLERTIIDRPSGGTLPVSALKGGVSGSVHKMHVQEDQKIILTGFFKYYVEANYDLVGADGRDSVHLDSTLVNLFVRLNPDGALDTTYNFDLENHRGKTGVNGIISDSYLQPDGKLILVGNFTRFNGQSVANIIRLDETGNLDPTFSPGSGADQPISVIEPGADGKLLIGGLFKRFDGAPASGVARLNANGSLDESFDVGEGADDGVSAIAELPGGEVVVAGAFKTFSGKVRNGFVVLDAKGALHPDYNTNGGFPGSFIAEIIPVPNEKALLAIGEFEEFDERPNFRIFRMNYQ